MRKMKNFPLPHLEFAVAAHVLDNALLDTFSLKCKPSKLAAQVFVYFCTLCYVNESFDLEVLIPEITHYTMSDLTETRKSLAYIQNIPIPSDLKNSHFVSKQFIQKKKKIDFLDLRWRMISGRSFIDRAMQLQPSSTSCEKM